MKKSSKIWKIEKKGYPNRGDCGPRFVESTQLIYKTELDCLLDIATDPGNVGLKVYEHQYKEETTQDLNSGKMFGIVTGRGEYSFERYLQPKEKIESDLDLELWKQVTWYDGNEYLKLYTQTVEHWVEVFMQ